MSKNKNKNEHGFGDIKLYKKLYIKPFSYNYTKIYIIRLLAIQIL